MTRLYGTYWASGFFDVADHGNGRQTTLSTLPSANIRMKANTERISLQERPVSFDYCHACFCYIPSPQARCDDVTALLRFEKECRIEGLCAVRLAWRFVVPAGLKVYLHLASGDMLTGALRSNVFAHRMHGVREASFPDQD